MFDPVPLNIGEVSRLKKTLDTISIHLTRHSVVMLWPKYSCPSLARPLDKGLATLEVTAVQLQSR